MNDNQPINSGGQPRRPPWNKGKLLGPKPPLRPSHVWCIWTKLQIAGRMRDLALFNLAIDSKLRGCDVVAVRVVMWRRMATPSTEPCSAKRKQVGQSVLSLRSKRVRHSTTNCA
jgi:hypothetical protein